MYGDIFCRVYNEFGWNYYPEIFGQQLLTWLDRQGFRPRRALDLACGTGVLCELLYKAGMEVTGMDLSGGMIAIARQGSPEIHYDVADMVSYRPAQPVDLITCTGDAVNHIPALSDVEAIFRNVYESLNPGGWFVFDLLREREISDSEPFEMDFTESTRVWFQMTRPEAGKVNLTVRVWEAGSLVCQEVIRETVHDPAAILALLERAGFRSPACTDRLLPDSNPGTTWFVTAQK